MLWRVSRAIEIMMMCCVEGVIMFCRQQTQDTGKSRGGHRTSKSNLREGPSMYNSATFDSDDAISTILYYNYSFLCNLLMKEVLMIGS